MQQCFFSTVWLIMISGFMIETLVISIKHKKAYQIRASTQYRISHGNFCISMYAYIWIPNILKRLEYIFYHLHIVLQNSYFSFKGYLFSVIYFWSLELVTFRCLNILNLLRWKTMPISYSLCPSLPEGPFHDSWSTYKYKSKNRFKKAITLTFKSLDSFRSNSKSANP